MSSANFDLEHFIIEISQEQSIWNLGKSKVYFLPLIVQIYFDFQ